LIFKSGLWHLGKLENLLKVLSAIPFEGTKVKDRTVHRNRALPHTRRKIPVLDFWKGNTSSLTYAVHSWDTFHMCLFARVCPRNEYLEVPFKIISPYCIFLSMKPNTLQLPISVTRKLALAIVDQLPSEEYSKFISDIRERNRTRDFATALEEVREKKAARSSH